MSQLGKPKRTTGCRTCKTRRVRCDEQKPSCARCIKAGRECLGYEPWRNLSPPERRSHSLSPPQIGSSRTLNQEEEFYFRAFVEDGPQQSVVASDVQFWRVVVPQLSEAEPAIRYATISIGALFMRHRLMQNSADPADHAFASKRALTYYNKSIQGLLSPSQPVSRETAIVSNVLFTCIECMQGRDAEALALFRQGRRILEENWTASSANTSLSDITERVKQILTRLRILALLYGAPMEDYNSPITVYDLESQTATPFDSFEEARLSLFCLTGDIHEFIRYCSRAKLDRADHEETVRHLTPLKTTLHTKLNHWRSRFWPLLEPAMYTPESIPDQIAVLSLQCQFYIVAVWLGCGLGSDECIWDHYLLCFQKIVDAAETVVDLLAKSNKSEQPFSMEIGIIAPLYLTALKCREPALRRKAIDLIRRGRQQEGLWEAKQIVNVLERAVEVEECHRPPGEYWPREELRLQAMLMYPRETRPDGERGNPVHFLLRPRERGKNWEVWNEWFRTTN